MTVSSGTVGPDLAERFFDEVSSASLTTIQFKSTRTLARAFDGLEDFDLLVPPEHFDDVLETARRLGFHLRRTDDPFHPAPVVDLLGWDADRQRLHHLSLHRSLVFGERPLKRHVVPWEHLRPLRLTQHRAGLQILPAAVESVLLLARIVLRSSRPRRLRSLRRRVAVPIEAGMRAELADLATTVSEADLREAAEEVLPGTADLLVHAYRAIMPCLRTDAAPELEATRRALVRALEAVAHRSSFQARLLMLRHARTRPIRTLERGAVIAVVGADGAGKSTVTTALVEILGSKLTVRRRYLGLPRDARALARAGLLVAATRRFRLRRSAVAFDALRTILAGRHRSRAVARSRRDAHQGVITVTDRYPLKEFQAMEPPMDGPRLNGDGFLGRVERCVYARIPQDVDVLIALVADGALLLARKPEDEEDPDVVHRKAAAVRDLGIARDDAIMIDALLPLETVVTQVTSAVWRHVTAPSR